MGLFNTISISAFCWCQTILYILSHWFELRYKLWNNTTFPRLCIIIRELLVYTFKTYLTPNINNDKYYCCNPVNNIFFGYLHKLADYLCIISTPTFIVFKLHSDEYLFCMKSITPTLSIQPMLDYAHWYGCFSYKVLLAIFPQVHDNNSHLVIKVSQPMLQPVVSVVYVKL